MDRPTCRTCPYWFWEGTAISENDVDAGEEGHAEVDGYMNALPGYSASNTKVDEAECRHRSPSTQMAECGSGIVSRTAMLWPMTGDWEFCGDHPDFPAYVASIRPTEPAPGARGED